MCGVPMKQVVQSAVAHGTSKKSSWYTRLANFFLLQSSWTSGKSQKASAVCFSDPQPEGTTG